MKKKRDTIIEKSLNHLCGKEVKYIFDRFVPNNKKEIALKKVNSMWGMHNGIPISKMHKASQNNAIFNNE